MTEALQNRGSTLVVVGSFAPAMFHPSWFARYDLLGKNETSIAAESQNLIVTSDISLFKVASFDFDIRPNRLQIGTTQENNFEATRDLMCSVLEIIDGIPIKQLGMNWTVHYTTQTKSAWHAAGDKLVPKDFWKRVWPKHVGMSNLSLQMERSDTETGSVNLVFQPSGLVANGVYVSVNDHYELKDGNGDMYSADAAKFLQTRWMKSKEVAEKIISDVYQETTNV
jgi:hypothetical protein